MVFMVLSLTWPRVVLSFASSIESHCNFPVICLWPIIIGVLNLELAVTISSIVLFMHNTPLCSSIQANFIIYIDGIEALIVH